MSDDRFVTRGMVVLTGVLVVAFTAAWLVMIVDGRSDGFPSEARLVLIGLVNLVVGFLGGRGVTRGS